MSDFVINKECMSIFEKPIPDYYRDKTYGGCFIAFLKDVRPFSDDLSLTYDKDLIKYVKSNNYKVTMNNLLSSDIHYEGIAKRLNIPCTKVKSLIKFLTYNDNSLTNEIKNDILDFVFDKYDPEYFDVIQDFDWHRQIYPYIPIDFPVLSSELQSTVGLKYRCSIICTGLFKVYNTISKIKQDNENKCELIFKIELETIRKELKYIQKRDRFIIFLFLSMVLGYYVYTLFFTPPQNIIIPENTTLLIDYWKKDVRYKWKYV